MRIHLHNFCFPVFTLAVLLTTLCCFKAHAQESQVSLHTGEQEVYSFQNLNNVGSQVEYHVTSKRVYVSNSVIGYSYTVFYLPDTPDVYIARGKVKYSSDFFGKKAYLILELSNNTVVLFYLNTGSSQTISPANTTAYARVIDIAGDDLYQIVQAGSNYYTYVSHDTGQTWLFDTLGLNTLRTFSSLALDSSQNVFLAGATGLYKQALGSTTWARTNCPLNPANYVFTDGINRIWVAGYDSFSNFGLYYSVDDGASWQLNISGFNRPYMNIIGLGTDPYGNIYAIGQDAGIYTNSGDVLYKSVGGTAAFTEIDAGIKAFNAQADDSAIINCVWGDSGNVYVATSIGGFISANGGALWQPDVPDDADACYGLVVNNTNDLLVSTNLGIFLRPSGDTSWTHVFPIGSYAGGQRIWRDDAGKLYSGISLASPTTYYPGPFVNAISSDNGLNWALDTAGISAVGQYNWWVDEAGNEYANSYGINWTKKAGGYPWAADTSGVAYSSAGDLGTAFGSDHNGNIYYAVYSGNIFSRPVGSTTWTEETGLGGDPVYRFGHTSNHTMIAGGTTNIHYKTTGAWQNMPVNSPAPSSTFPYIVAVDDSDNVWCAFSHIGSEGHNQGDGVFYTPDLGNHWYPAGGQVTLLTFNWLVPVGDSVFGITYGSGVYVFKRNGSSGIHQIASNNQLSIYPNPATNSCTVTYNLTEAAQNPELLVYDMAGKVLKTMLIPNGNSSVTLRTNDLSSGDYLCAIQQGGKIVAVEKLVVK